MMTNADDKKAEIAKSLRTAFIDVRETLEGLGSEERDRNNTIYVAQSKYDLFQSLASNNFFRGEGLAFGEFCFIKSGDFEDFIVVKRDFPFEVFKVDFMRNQGLLKKYWCAMQVATDEELKDLTYIKYANLDGRYTYAPHSFAYTRAFGIDTSVAKRLLNFATGGRVMPLFA